MPRSRHLCICATQTNYELAWLDSRYRSRVHVTLQCRRVINTTVCTNIIRCAIMLICAIDSSLGLRLSAKGAGKTEWKRACGRAWQISTECRRACINTRVDGRSDETKVSISLAKTISRINDHPGFPDRRRGSPNFVMSPSPSSSSSSSPSNPATRGLRERDLKARFNTGKICRRRRVWASLSISVTVVSAFSPTRGGDKEGKKGWKLDARRCIVLFRGNGAADEVNDRTSLAIERNLLA